MEEKINLLYNKDKLKISKYEDSIIFESGHHPKGRKPERGELLWTPIPQKELSSVLERLVKSTSVEYGRVNCDDDAALIFYKEKNNFVKVLHWWNCGNYEHVIPYKTLKGISCEK
ncbi:MAG: hypothetical protein KJ583_07080 [Nanoarchaeota archaeon]|nr:hypothetical protein [Nanoarchaeota archaeon]MBU1270468.1 hypothetical protein [Nanoarchaeota archaeon]MBU1605049.1 hypothetical protein [Nanoarchaeota archaeon]MBU2443708.1 hypothetical protein [Nanoarchaeota archaeon]